MQELFNSTFEVFLRLMLLLSTTGGIPMTVDRIAAYDVMTIYSRDFGLSDEVLHGDNEFGLSEFASRRNKAQIALRELVLNGSVKAVTSDKGFSYQISNLIALCKSCHSHIHAKRGDYWGNRRRGHMCKIAKWMTVGIFTFWSLNHQNLYFLLPLC